MDLRQTAVEHLAGRGYDRGDVERAVERAVVVAADSDVDTVAAGWHALAVVALALLRDELVTAWLDDAPDAAARVIRLGDTERSTVLGRLGYGTVGHRHLLG